MSLNILVQISILESDFTEYKEEFITRNLISYISYSDTEGIVQFISEELNQSDWIDMESLLKVLKISYDKYCCKRYSPGSYEHYRRTVFKNGIIMKKYGPRDLQLTPLKATGAMRYGIED